MTAQRVADPLTMAIWRRDKSDDGPSTKPAAGHGQQTTQAGAIFPAACTPKAIGDAVGGRDPALTPARLARFSSGLSVMEFIKRTTLAKLTPAVLKAIGSALDIWSPARALGRRGLCCRHGPTGCPQGQGQSANEKGRTLRSGPKVTAKAGTRSASLRAAKSDRARCALFHRHHHTHRSSD